MTVPSTVNVRATSVVSVASDALAPVVVLSESGVALAVLVVTVVDVVAVPPPSGIVMVRLFWLVARVRVGSAEAVARLMVRASVTRVRKLKTPKPRKLLVNRCILREEPETPATT